MTPHAPLSPESWADLPFFSTRWSVLWDRLAANPDWQPAWGGDLELWDREMRGCAQRIAPVANRCVVFSTTRDSYHGMPDPLRCPDGVTRRSLALYYYSNGRPESERGPDHSTLWQARPGEA